MAGSRCAPLECGHHAVVEGVELIDHGVGMQDLLAILQPASQNDTCASLSAPSSPAAPGPRDRVRPQRFEQAVVLIAVGPLLG